MNTTDAVSPSAAPGDISIQIHAPADVTGQAMMLEVTVIPILDAIERR